MFNLEYIAAEVGANIEEGSDVFMTESVVANEEGKVVLTKTAQPIVSGGKVYAWAKAAVNAGAEMTRYEVAEDNTITGIAGEEYCLLYKYTDDLAKQITVNAQFIPDTLHAVLTVALYLGDACEVEAATKAGEVVIDIPRFQLSGSMDITMSATGAAQTPLEGNALAAGCQGCNGDGIYATITKVVFNAKWTDEVEEIYFEGEEDIPAAVRGVEYSQQLEVYANKGALGSKKISADKFTWSPSVPTLGLSVNENGLVSGTPDGEGTVEVTAVAKEREDLVATVSISVEAAS